MANEGDAHRGRGALDVEDNGTNERRRTHIFCWGLRWRENETKEKSRKKEKKQKKVQNLR